MNYSSITDNIDFMSFTNLKTSKGVFTGTSCATPCFAAMLGLVQGFFIEKIGRKLTNEELLDFIKENTQDLDKEGFDEKTGFGIFVLPDPDEINLSKFLECPEFLKSFVEAESPYWIDTAYDARNIMEIDRDYVKNLVKKMAEEGKL